MHDYLKGSNQCVYFSKQSAESLTVFGIWTHCGLASTTSSQYMYLLSTSAFLEFPNCHFKLDRKSHIVLNSFGMYWKLCFTVTFRNLFFNSRISDECFLCILDSYIKCWVVLVERILPETWVPDGYNLKPEFRVPAVWWRNGLKRQVEQGFSSFFANFLAYFISFQSFAAPLVHSTTNHKIFSKAHQGLFCSQIMLWNYK